jgi:hypothetical protein
VYSQEELNRILPDDVICWMKLRSFGTPDPKLDADPKLARSNTLQFYKKALSFFHSELLDFLEYYTDGRQPHKELGS